MNSQKQKRTSQNFGNKQKMLFKEISPANKFSKENQIEAEIEEEKPETIKTKQIDDSQKLSFNISSGRKFVKNSIISEIPKGNYVDCDKFAEIYRNSKSEFKNIQKIPNFNYKQQNVLNYEIKSSGGTKKIWYRKSFEIIYLVFNFISKMKLQFYKIKEINKQYFELIGDKSHFINSNNNNNDNNGNDYKDNWKNIIACSRNYSISHQRKFKGKKVLF